MKGQPIENGRNSHPPKTQNHYLTIFHQNKKYRVNVKDIKKLYKVERRLLPVP